MDNNENKNVTPTAPESPEVAEKTPAPASAPAEETSVPEAPKPTETPAPNPVLAKLPSAPDKNRVAAPAPPPVAPDDAATAATAMTATAPTAAPAPTPAPAQETAPAPEKTSAPASAPEAPVTPETPKTPDSTPVPQDNPFANNLPPAAPSKLSGMLGKLKDNLKDSFKVDLNSNSQIEPPKTEETPKVEEAPKSPEVAEKTSAPTSTPETPVAPVAPTAPEPPKSPELTPVEPPKETPAAAIEAALATAPPSPTSSAWAKTPFYKKPLFIGLICTIIGLGIGVCIVFAIKSTEKPQTCPACNCENATTSQAVVENTDPTTAFLNLEPQGQNLLYSPLSIRYGLATLDAGASGTTKSQIDTILSGTKFPNYSSLPDSLAIANAFAAKSTYQDMLLPSFVSTATKNYNTEVIYDELKNTVNLDTWLKNKTFGLIDTIGTAVNANMESVLLTSLALQADWQIPFNETNTAPASFSLEGGSETLAQTMQLTTASDDVLYYRNTNLSLLSLPLNTGVNGPNLDFITVTPSGSLATYVSTLSDLSDIETALSSATPASKAENGLLISLPKFKIDSTLNFASDLELLGITDAFSADAASFPNITSLPEGIHLGTAIHKNSLSLEEAGLNSALNPENPASASLTPDATPVSINSPFLFLIRDRDNGTIWMVGTVFTPSW